MLQQWHYNTQTHTLSAFDLLNSRLYGNDVSAVPLIVFPNDFQFCCDALWDWARVKRACGHVLGKTCGIFFAIIRPLGTRDAGDSNFTHYIRSETVNGRARPA